MWLTKDIQKLIKKKFHLKIDRYNTKGVVTINRIKVQEWKGYAEKLYCTCEVDITYKGTVNRWGTKMGPVKGISPYSPYCTYWGSKVSRNKSLRSEVSVEIKDLLRYFGIDVVYRHNLKIMKITWDE